jgi:drug/metabolite transporter (DMT)-like permease
VVPVIAVVLAVVFLGESLTIPIGVGAVLILAGVMLTERSIRHVPVAGVNTAR